MKPKTAQPTWRRFLHANEGIAAVEFVFVAPVLILMLFAIIEFSLIMLVSNMMESATNMSSRLGKTGYAQAGLSREDTILASVRTRLGTLITPANLTVTTRVYSQLDDIGDAEPWTDTNHNGLAEIGEFDDINGNGVRDLDMVREGYGDADDIVVYTVSYPWSVQTPIMREFIGDAQGHIRISSKAVVKNEPYDN